MGPFSPLVLTIRLFCKKKYCHEILTLWVNESVHFINLFIFQVFNKKFIIKFEKEFRK